MKKLKNVLDLSRGTTGAVYELEVAADLMRKGFEVYRNLSPNGAADLVVTVPAISTFAQVPPFRVQVKCHYSHTGGNCEGLCFNDVVASYGTVDGQIRYFVRTFETACLFLERGITIRCLGARDVDGPKPRELKHGCKEWTNDSSGYCSKHRLEFVERAKMQTDLVEQRKRSLTQSHLPVMVAG
jgi:hypothetical protein